mmetsp:Transcript_495/g.839  ORF Transcript_495/g.839 Transcript_495/m.839 type:complete len:100 (-) Transcript_495:621-920(-)|eukprot:CAMPEP_0184657202 /NCGR_PEP_ID=MMETSP0308-20130426/17634_1 /TAXON_ID=38269 /ORGANISM="Gloeochaete witrockiana, Strain SAG 46.84" /LENGTH=99 /DNA_ID=CAMNT_0027094721 /DNA_START=47 /DNA_END=346 /DNA_ORIENTATION=+
MEAAPLLEFLRAVQARRVHEAIKLSEQILEKEPENKLIRSYQPVLLELKSLGEEWIVDVSKAHAESVEEESEESESASEIDEESDNSEDEPETKSASAA